MARLPTRGPNNIAGIRFPDRYKRTHAISSISDIPKEYFRRVGRAIEHDLNAFSPIPIGKKNLFNALSRQGLVGEYLANKIRSGRFGRRRNRTRIKSDKISVEQQLQSTNDDLGSFVDAVYDTFSRVDQEVAKIKGDIQRLAKAQDEFQDQVQKVFEDMAKQNEKNLRDAYSARQIDDYRSESNVKVRDDATSPFIKKIENSILKRLFGKNIMNFVPSGSQAIVSEGTILKYLLNPKVLGAVAGAAGIGTYIYKNYNRLSTDTSKKFDQSTPKENFEKYSANFRGYRNSKSIRQAEFDREARRGKSFNDLSSGRNFYSVETVGNKTTISAPTLEIKSTSPNTIKFNSPTIEFVQQGIKLTKNGFEYINGGNPAWAKKAFDEGYTSSPRSFSRRSYPSFTQSFNRHMIERDKQNFLAYGQLPRGFEYLPGHMGILGNPGAVMARGVMPLNNNFGGRSFMSSGGGRGIGGYSGGGSTPFYGGSGGSSAPSGGGSSVPSGGNSSNNKPMISGGNSNQPSGAQNNPPSFPSNGSGGIDVNMVPGAYKTRKDVAYDGRTAPTRYNNPGGAYPRKDLEKYGLMSYGIIGGGHKIGQYPTAEHGAAANMAHMRTLYKNGMTVGEMRNMWVTGRRGGFMNLPGMNSKEVITQDKLNDPVWMGRWMKATAKAEGFKGSIDTNKAFQLYSTGGGKTSPVPMPSPGGFIKGGSSSLSDKIPYPSGNLPDDATPQNYRNRWNRMSGKVNPNEMVSFKNAYGHNMRVHSSSARAYEGMFKDLKEAGYPVTGVGSYNYRMQRGGSRLSQHAYGNAVDINDSVKFSKAQRQWMAQNPGAYDRILGKWGMLNRGGGMNWDEQHVEFGGSVPKSTYNLMTNAKPSSSGPSSSGGNLIVFRGLNSQIDEASVRKIAAQKGLNPVFFNHTQQKEALDFLRKNKGTPYETLGFSAGVHTQNRFLDAAKRQGLPLATNAMGVGQYAPGKRNLPGNAGVPSQNFIDPSGRGLQGVGNAQYFNTTHMPINGQGGIMNKVYESMYGNQQSAQAQNNFQRVIQTQQKVAGIRRLPIKNELKSYLDYAAAQAGDNIGFEVSSGGQHKTGPRTGSHRHDVDNPHTPGAADGRLFIMENGKKRYLSIYNKNDLPIINRFVKAFASVTPGAGVGANYMGSGAATGQLIHFGGANYKGGPAVNYSGANYIGNAFQSGVKLYGTKDIKDRFNLHINGKSIDSVKQNNNDSQQYAFSFDVNKTITSTYVNDVIKKSGLRASQNIIGFNSDPRDENMGATSMKNIKEAGAKYHFYDEGPGGGPSWKSDMNNPKWEERLKERLLKYKDAYSYEIDNIDRLGDPGSIMRSFERIQKFQKENGLSQKLVIKNAKASLWEALGKSGSVDKSLISKNSILEVGPTGYSGKEMQDMVAAAKKAGYNVTTTGNTNYYATDKPNVYNESGSGGTTAQPQSSGGGSNVTPSQVVTTNPANIQSAPQMPGLQGEPGPDAGKQPDVTMKPAPTIKATPGSVSQGEQGKGMFTEPVQPQLPGPSLPSTSYAGPTEGQPTQKAVEPEESQESVEKSDASSGGSSGTTEGGGTSSGRSGDSAPSNLGGGNHPESSASEPGSGGYGSYGRCWI